MNPPVPFAIESAERRARENVAAMADGLARVLRVAQALLGGGNRLDLTGLDDLFGLLCARALDLRPDHGRSLQPKLLALRDGLDSLLATFAPRRLN